MNGQDFIAVDSSLVASPTLGDPEARFRSAVSRAYYRVFHFAVEVLSQYGVSIPQNPEARNQAVLHFQKTRNEIAMEAARRIGDLRTERNTADYKLNNKKYSKMNNAKLCVEDAYNAIQVLEKCLEEPSRTELKKYFNSP